MLSKEDGLLDMLMGGIQVIELSCAFVGGLSFPFTDDREKSVMGRTVISVCEYHSSRFSL